MVIAGINFTVALQHLAHLSPSAHHIPNASPILLFQNFNTVQLLFLLVYSLQLIPFFLHHSNVDLPYLLPSLLPPTTTSNHPLLLLLLSQQIIHQKSNAHTVNSTHTLSVVLASSAKQQVVVVGNQNKSPFSSVTDYLYQVVKHLTK